jgi:hypothetical protein
VGIVEGCIGGQGTKQTSAVKGRRGGAGGGEEETEEKE